LLHFIPEPEWKSLRIFNPRDRILWLSQRMEMVVRSSLAPSFAYLIALVISSAGGQSRHSGSSSTMPCLDLPILPPQSTGPYLLCCSLSLPTPLAVSNSNPCSCAKSGNQSKSPKIPAFPWRASISRLLLLPRRRRRQWRRPRRTRT
jgi:hypothetical protein